ncbi:MAG: site-2 protease family protein [Acidobacteria bacterium]|nr:site-2 protease family protein [Acidobacteriota bacterium]MBK8149697.1 site-2 protease family protein [Acidobacteriota bacterium]
MLGFLEIFRRQILLARVSGIPVRIDLRWLFVVALMSWITAAYLSPRYVENFAAALSIGAATTIVLFLSIFIHELAHSMVARWEGVEVLEIVLHPFGGLARFRREPDTPRAEFRIGVAGPAASFALAVVFALLMAAANGLQSEVLILVLFFLALWNFMLAVFNMFPGYPLDGGRVLRAYLWRRGMDLNEATIVTGKFGKVIAGSLMAFGLIVSVLRGDFFTGFWSILVGYFLYDSARGIIEEVRRFDGMTVEEAMELPVTVAPEMNLLLFVDTVLPQHRRAVFLVAKNKQFFGVLLLEELKTRPRETWHKVRVQDAMRPVEPDFFVETNAPLADAKILLRENGINALGVIDEEGRLVGFLQRGRIRKRS